MKGIYISVDFSAVLYWTKDRFYRDVEQKYAEQGINISIQEVSVIPLEIEGDWIKYLVTPIDYEYVGYSDRQLAHSDIDD